VSPVCHPTRPDQAYIDADNAMLEREQRFASREIVVRMEYKHCPNLTIIDTPGTIGAGTDAGQGALARAPLQPSFGRPAPACPGLISPAPGKKNCALQACAAQVEEIVRNKAQVRTAGREGW
jgi:hypothetical protein